MCATPDPKMLTATTTSAELRHGQSPSPALPWVVDSDHATCFGVVGEEAFDAAKQALDHATLHPCA